MSTVQDMATYAQATTGNKIVWNDKLADTFLTRNTFFTLIDKLGMGRHPTENQKFNWGEYTDDVISLTTKAGDDGDHIEDSGTDWKSLVIGDILYCPELGTYLRVETTPTTDDINVGKLNVSSGAATDVDGTVLSADYAAGLIYYKIGSMEKDGSLVLDSALDDIAFAKDVDNAYNYTQIFQDWAKVSRGSASNEWQFTGKTRQQHLRAVKLAKHIDKIEKTMWFGVQVVDGDAATAGDGRYGTRGVFNFSNVQSETGTMAGFDFNDFIDFTQTKVMAYNEKEELDAFCNRYMLTQIADWVNNTAHLNFDASGTKDQFGIRVYRLVTPHVTLNFRYNRSLQDIYPAKAVLAALDMTKLGLRYKAGNGYNFNTSMELNVQPKRANFYLDKIYTEAGLELVNAKNHSTLILS